METYGKAHVVLETPPGNACRLVDKFREVPKIIVEIHWVHFSPCLQMRPYEDEKAMQMFGQPIGRQKTCSAYHPPCIRLNYAFFRPLPRSLCLFKLKIENATEKFENHQGFSSYLCFFQSYHF
jgi:hypothetical protein